MVEFCFNVLKVQKQVKYDSISFNLEISMKGQALDDLFKFNESEKIEMTTQEIQAKGVPDICELQYTPWFPK